MIHSNSYRCTQCDMPTIKYHGKHSFKNKKIPSYSLALIGWLGCQILKTCCICNIPQSTILSIIMHMPLIPCTFMAQTRPYNLCILGAPLTTTHHSLPQSQTLYNSSKSLTTTIDSQPLLLAKIPSNGPSQQRLM